ncbi:MAG TPA: glycerophosphoryl diester phosphodiesterase membrane domain-containing protein [Allosphingosinicella sp.]|nr:glycerophosphoryl diester phosphodiesterase membrane domain-containing protein [Allosphingosinicella sp.]
MANLSITTAWNESVSFLKREAGLVLPIAFLLVGLPTAAFQLAAPVMAPGSTPEAGLWLLLLPLGMVAGMVGGIAISYLALRPGTSVGEALQVGLRRFIMLFGASLLIFLAAMLILVPLILIVAGGAIFSGTTNPHALVGPLLLVFLIFSVIAVAFWVRLALMSPVTAVEDAGPIGIIRRSWQLTAGHFWKLLGFMLLLLLAMLILMFAITAVLGIIVALSAGPPTPGSLSIVIMTIVSALIQSIASALFAIVFARIYHQLSARDSASQVFV